jgi:hypothetical protein
MHESAQPPWVKREGGSGACEGQAVLWAVSDTRSYKWCDRKCLCGGTTLAVQVAIDSHGAGASAACISTVPSVPVKSTTSPKPELLRLHWFPRHRSTPRHKVALPPSTRLRWRQRWPGGLPGRCGCLDYTAVSFLCANAYQHLLQGSCIVVVSGDGSLQVMLREWPKVVDLFSSLHKVVVPWCHQFHNGAHHFQLLTAPAPTVLVVGTGGGGSTGSGRRQPAGCLPAGGGVGSCQGAPAQGRRCHAAAGNTGV